MKEKHRSEKLHFVMATKGGLLGKKTNNPKFNIQIMLEASRNLAAGKVSAISIVFQSIFLQNYTLRCRFFLLLSLLATSQLSIIT